MITRLIAVAGLLMFAGGSFAQTGIPPCGPGAPCTIGGVDPGTYYLAFPDNWDGKTPLKPFVFFHGHSGSGSGEIKNNGLVKPLTKEGYVFVAPDGAMIAFRNRNVRSWAAYPENGQPRSGRNDISFVEKVLEDVARRVSLVPGSTLVSGFSSGGSMAWFFSCYSKITLAGVIPIAGGLRRPLPPGGKNQADGSIATTCPGGPRKLVHVHGFIDRQVPLEGRRIRNWHQGDVFEGLAIQRNTNLCESRPDSAEAKGPVWCRTWSSCKTAIPMRFCLHAGGHWVPKGWPAQALDWINAPGAGPALLGGR
jgi:polyhydroxybutyrate depolymerase